MVDVNGVYNDKNKLIVPNRNFMTITNIEICMADIKNKKCEGFDRILLCVISDARNQDPAIIDKLPLLFGTDN